VRLAIREVSGLEKQGRDIGDGMLWEDVVPGLRRFIYDYLTRLLVLSVSICTGV